MRERMIQAYKVIKDRTRLIILLYLVTVFVSMVISINVGLLLADNFTGSLAMSTLLSGFDRTVFGDLITNKENWTSNLYALVLIATLFYLVISVLANSIFIASIVKSEPSFRKSFIEGRRYFFPFLGFALLFYMVILILIAAIGYLYFYFLGDPAADYKNEKPFIYSLMSILFLVFLLVNHVWILSLNARRNYIEGNQFFNAIKRSFAQTFKKFVSNTLWLLMFWALILVLFLLMKEAHKYNSAASWMKMTATFFMMQLIVFARIWLKYYFMSLILYRRVPRESLKL